MLLRRTRHRLKGSGKCTQWRVLNFTRRLEGFEFYKFAPSSPPKLKSIRLGVPPPVLNPHILPSSLPQPLPTHPAPKPQICTVFLLLLPALKPHLFYLSFPTSPQNHAAKDVSSPTGSVSLYGVEPQLLTILVHYRLK